MLAGTIGRLAVAASFSAGLFNKPAEQIGSSELKWQKRRVVGAGRSDKVIDQQPSSTGLMRRQARLSMPQHQMIVQPRV